MLEPVVSRLAQDWADKIKVVKLDIDENIDLQRVIKSWGATLMLFITATGRKVTGYQPLDRITEKIKIHVE
jgi:thiol-disulfide isomerase/thioredoxin